jgi:tetratricopeptide (TPR) repeat protein
MLTRVPRTGPMTQQRTRAKTDELRRSGHFDEAAKEYAALWPDGDPWTGWGYAHCLRKLGRTREAIEVAREVHTLAPDFRLGRSMYAWTLYDCIRSIDVPEPALLTAAETIISLTGSDEQAYAPTSPFVATVLRVAKACAMRGRDVRALEWLNKLDPTQLPTEPRIWSDETGRKRELASARERYYATRTHAFERLRRWQECLETTNRALTDCGPLHHDNDVWFARRIALAKLNLGRPQEALAELEQLAARKPTSFMQTDIAKAAWAAGDVERTFKHALQALQAPGDIRFKLEGVRLLAEVLWRRGETDYARTHLSLCIAVRNSKSWKPKEELTKLATSWEVNGIPGDPNPILSELQPLWKRWNDDLAPRRAGTIVRMFPHGRAGFIRSDDKGQFYFDTRDWEDRRSKPVEGTRVTFTTRPGFDRKRQRSTTVACEVRAASSEH